MTAIPKKHGLPAITGNERILCRLFATFGNKYICGSCGEWLDSSRVGRSIRHFSCPNNCGTDAVSSLLEEDYKAIGSGTIKYYSEEELQSFSKPVAVVGGDRVDC